MANLYSRRCSFLIHERLWSLFPPEKGGGGGVTPGFQMREKIKWGQKSKPKEIPRASNKTPK